MSDLLFVLIVVAIGLGALFLLLVSVDLGIRKQNRESDARKDRPDEDP